MKRGIVLGSLVIVLAIVFLSMSSMVRHKYGQRSDFIESRKRILEVVGISSLALSGECAATRALTEGLVSCLGDVPGGYCWHTTCDIVACDDDALEQISFVLEVKQ